jgi:hypothetical protein
MIAARQSIEVAVFENDFSVLAGLTNVLHVDAGVTQDIERVSERPAH